MAWYDESETGAFDIGGFGDVDFSSTGAFDQSGFDIGNLINLDAGAFDQAGFGDVDLFNLANLTGAFDQGGFGDVDLFNLADLTGAFDQGGFGSIDLSALAPGGAFDMGGMGDIDLSETGAFDVGGLGGVDLSDTGAFDISGFGGIDLKGVSPDVQADIAEADPYAGLGYTKEEIEQLQKGTYGGPEQTEAQLRSQLGDELYEEMYGPYAGLGYSKKDIDQLRAGTYAGQEQTEAQVREQLGEDLYKQLYPEGVDKLSSGSYTGLGYTAKEIADMMAAASGVRDTDWSGVIKTDSKGNITQIGNQKFGKDTDKKTDGKKTEDKKTDDTKKIIDTIRSAFGNKDNAMLMALLGGLLGLLGKGKGGATLPGGYKGGIPKYTATRGPAVSPTAGGRRAGGAGIGSLTGGVSYAAQGGLMGLAGGGRPARYLRGGTDGMADKIKTDIDGKQPARLSHGEFVIPADVVSHLGNGNSDAGADVLYEMMDKVRKERTGTTKQGKQINPRKMLPA